MSQAIFNWTISNLAWTLLWSGACSLMITVSGLAIFKKGLNLLPSRQNVIWFSSGMFALVFFALVVGASASRNGTYRLQGEISEAAFGGQMSPTGTDNDMKPNDRVIFVLTAYNTGSMPTIIKSIRVDVVLGSSLYHARILQYAQSIEFPLKDGHSATFHPEDDFLNKMATPIPPGGEVVGLVVAVVPDVPAAALGDPSLAIIASFQDIQGDTFQADNKSASLLKELTAIPGLNPDIH